MKNKSRFLPFLAFLILPIHSALPVEKDDLLARNIDLGTPPQTDFFQYANGKWLKNNPIPDSESGWGVGEVVQEEIYKRILAINEGAQKSKNETGSTAQKIADFWTSAMNTKARDHAALKPLKADLAAIDKLKSYQDFAPLIAKFKMDGVQIFFNSEASQDQKSSEQLIYQFGQGGLGLPKREYYFHTDDRTLKVRAEYKNYLTQSFILLGAQKTAATAAMNAVYELEDKLADSSKKLEDLRDPIENYHKMTWDELSAQAPNFNWKAFAKDIGIKRTDDSVVVGQPAFFVNLSKELKDTPISTWKNYLKFRLLSSHATELDEKSFQNYFNYTKSLTGAKSPRELWKRSIDQEERFMGELVGQLFAKQYFNETAKKRYSDLVEAIRTAYADRIKHLPWMSDATKAKALDKLSKVSKKVGYPDQWKDFSSLSISKNSFYDNAISAAHYWHSYNIHKLGKPVDHLEWTITPQTYNAYYEPTKNEIVLPAGIFAVPGMKDADLDDAFVYGYAGASTIGHEITHGFDDEGRQYDAGGSLAQWWTPEDEKEFKVRANAIVEEFNEFIPLDNLHVNGAATEGENIADLGGLLLGLDAFKKTAQFHENKTIAGLTPIQRYFLGYAYGWLYQNTKENLARQLMADVHAPAKQRVNGPMMNIEDFYAAFGIKKGDKMYRDEKKRVSIW